MARLTFKRDPKETSFAAMACNSELRTCYIRRDGVNVGRIFNQAYSKVLGGDDVWRITLFVSVADECHSVTLKGRYETLDDAKDFVRKNWERICEKWDIAKED